MKPNSRQIGNLGEKIAARYLLNRDYKIVTLNYQKALGEIDIIALDENGDLVFFEAKTRSSRQFGEPYEAVDDVKQCKLVRTATSFLQDNPVWASRNFRIDVLSISVDWLSRRAQVEHIRNAVEDIE